MSGWWFLLLHADERFPRSYKQHIGCWKGSSLCLLGCLGNGRYDVWRRCSDPGYFTQKGRDFSTRHMRKRERKRTSYMEGRVTCPMSSNTGDPLMRLIELKPRVITAASHTQNTTENHDIIGRNSALPCSHWVPKDRRSIKEPQPLSASLL